MQNKSDTVTDQYGNVVLTAAITVIVHGGGAAVVYSDNGSTVLTQPFYPQADHTQPDYGKYSFYAADGRYDVIATYGGKTYTDPDILLQDPTTDLSASAGSSLVGFSQKGTGAISRTLQTELRETVKITQFGALGQNETADTNALTKAILSLGSTGGIIFLPPLATGAYLFDPYTLADLGTGTNAIELCGSGWATQIQIASACTNFFTLNGAWSSLHDFQIIDPNNYCTNAFILSKPSSGSPSLERIIERVRGIGPGTSSTATFLVNDGGQQLHASKLYAQNMLGAFWNKGGGVDSTFEYLYGLGIKYGVRLDYDATYGHAENLKINNTTMLCTQANAIALWVTNTLALQIDTFTGAQLGSGGIGCYFDGITGTGSTMSFLNNCYFEGSDTGPAIKSRGVNAGFHMMGGGFGQGSYAANVINGIDFDAANAFIFDNVEAFFPAGNANKVAAFSNSSGVITETCKGWGLTNNPNSETSCAINWELASGEGLPSTRFTTSTYPNGDWTSWTPTVTSGAGTITTVGALDCADVVQGKECSVRLNITITTNGTGASSVFATLRTAAKTGKSFIISGRDNGVSGKILQGLISASGVTIFNYDNTYPGANGANLILTGTYEIN